MTVVRMYYTERRPVRITSNGKPAHTLVRDAETGEMVHGVIGLTWKSDDVATLYYRSAQEDVHVVSANLTGKAVNRQPLWVPGNWAVPSWAWIEFTKVAP